MGTPGPFGHCFLREQVAKRYTAYPPEKMKELMQRQDASLGQCSIMYQTYIHIIMYVYIYKSNCTCTYNYVYMDIIHVGLRDVTNVYFCGRKYTDRTWSGLFGAPGYPKKLEFWAFLLLSLVAEGLLG